jgi:hypothetical protein
MCRLRGRDEHWREIPGRESMIRPHKRIARLWFALVAPSVIMAELNRDISPDYPIAEANYTITRIPYVAPNGHSGWYHEHKTEQCLQFRTYSGPANEMAQLALRQVLHTVARHEVEVKQFRAWFRRLLASTDSADCRTKAAVTQVQLLLEAFDRERLTLEDLLISLRDLSFPQPIAA